MILFVISGERVVGRGSDLYQLCKDIDDTIKGKSSEPTNTDKCIRTCTVPMMQSVI